MARHGGTKTSAKAVSDGRRPATTQNRAHGRGDSLDPAGPLIEPDGTGIAEVEEDGYHQRTALFDKGELLGELAELQAEKAPDTRAAVEVDDGPKGCRIIVVAGPDLGLEWSFKKPEVTIGRAAENDLDFTDIAVSRNHARISREGNSFFLTDLGSDNGTLLNGVRIEHEALSSGDEIIVGARTLRFVELTEAPPTSAAEPVIEPEVGDPVVASSAKEPALKLNASQIDVNVVPDADGPKIAKDTVAPDPTPAKDRRPAKLVAVLVVGLVLLGGLGFLGYEVVRRVQAEKDRVVELEARTYFLQSVELVRMRRFGDALTLLEKVLQLRPEHARAKDYQAHAVKELDVWSTLDAAAGLAEERRWDEALVKLEPISRGIEGSGADFETAWAPEIAALLARCKKAVAEAQIEEARQAYEADERELAMDLIARALVDDPNLASALALRERLLATQKPVVKAAPPKPTTPPELEHAVSLYKSDRIPAAIDAAEAAGGPSAVKYIERMRTMAKLLEDLGAAHRQKAAAEIVRLAPKALEIDAQIALGGGEIRARLKEFHADALYLKGFEAFQDGDYGKSFQLLNQALRAAPGHRLSENRISDLQLKARDLYYQGYSLKDSNPEETRRIFKQITQMTRATNQFHQWSQRWLAGNGG